MIDWAYCMTTPEFLLGIMGIIVLGIGSFLIKFKLTIMGILLSVGGLIVIGYVLYSFYNYIMWVGLNLIPI